MLATANTGKIRRGSGKHACEWTGRVEISQEEIRSSKHSTTPLVNLIYIKMIVCECVCVCVQARMCACFKFMEIYISLTFGLKFHSITHLCMGHHILNFSRVSAFATEHNYAKANTNAKFFNIRETALQKHMNPTNKSYLPCIGGAGGEREGVSEGSRERERERGGESGGGGGRRESENS